MKAVVLVGGEGTRMRPLTETTPKPLLPLMNRPFLHQVLDHLGAHGVHEVIASSPYLEETFGPFLESRHGDPKVTWITEAEPLGTAGAIVNALDEVGDETFLVLNGDVLTDLDLTSLVAFHRSSDAVATISLHHVEDARPYGLVDYASEGRVREFREKPEDLIPGDINAGTYVLQPSALAGWERGRMISIEREVYPQLIERGEPVFAYLSDAYWMDMGTPERYLQAHFDSLEGMVKGLEHDAPFIAHSASVEGAVGPLCVIGDGVRIGLDADVQRTVVHEDAVVAQHAMVTDSIVGPRSGVGADAIVERSVLGEGAIVAPGARITDARVGAGERAEA